MLHERYIANWYNQIPRNLPYTDRCHYNTLLWWFLAILSNFFSINSTWYTATIIGNRFVKESISFIMLGQRMMRFRYSGGRAPGGFLICYSFKHWLFSLETRVAIVPRLHCIAFFLLVQHQCVLQPWLSTKLFQGGKQPLGKFLPPSHPRCP